ncbi:MAG: type II toxin-antitoxin system RelE/ParE family toxin [Pseudomonadota bacterium]
MLYELTLDAEEDLQKIFDYTLSKYGAQQLESYKNLLKTCTEDLATGKAYTKKMDISASTVHIKFCEHHYIFGIRRDNLPMLILAIFHERMDLMQRLKGRLQEN